MSRNAPSLLNPCEVPGLRFVNRHCHDVVKVIIASTLDLKRIGCESQSYLSKANSEYIQIRMVFMVMIHENYSVLATFSHHWACLGLCFHAGKR